MVIKASRAVIRAATTAIIVSAPLATAQAGSPRWTWIDPGNDARVEDFFGVPGSSVCVQAVDAATHEPTTVRLWRDATPGGQKDLDSMTGSRNLTTKGGRYSVFVRNTSGRPVYAGPCAANVKRLPAAKGNL